MFLKRRASIVALALAAACGQPDSEPDSIAVDPDAAMDTTPAGTPAPPSPDVIADDARRVIEARLTEWTIELSADTVQAGQITFQAMNMGTVQHALEVEGNGVEEETRRIPPGATATLVVDLRPGTYEVYCPVGNGQDHRGRGMTTRLVVVEAGRERSVPL